MTHQACMWTNEQVDTLTRLWMDGVTCTKIAEQIHGATRNAVIGKVQRLGLPPRKSGGQPGQGGGPFGRKVRPSKPRKAKPKAKAPLRRIKVPPLKPQPVNFTAGAWEPLAWATPVTLEHVTGCRWPASDPFAPIGSVDLFCNCKPVEGKSYCAEHQARSVGNGTSYERSADKTARTEARWEALSAPAKAMRPDVAEEIAREAA